MIAESESTTLPAHKTFSQRLALLFVGLASILLTVGIGVWFTTDRFVQNSGWVSHSHEVEGRVWAALARISAMRADATAYTALGNEALFERFQNQLPLLDEDLKSLAQLVQDNPVQIAHVQDFAASVLQHRDAATAAIQGHRAAQNAPGTVSDLASTRARALARVVLDEEDKLLQQRRSDSKHTAALARMMVAIATLLSLAVLLFAFLVVNASHRRGVDSNHELQQSNVQLGAALDETRRIGESMQKLGQFGEMLQSCREFDEVRAGLGGALTGLLPRFGGHLALINPSQDLAVVGAHWGTHALLAESIFPPEDCWALRRGQAYPLAGTSAGFVCKHVSMPSDEQPAPGYLCIPLAAQGEVIGVLTLDGPEAPNAAERRVAMAAGEQLGLALANLRLQETLRTQSIRDPLTGLFNRRYLEVSLERELMRAARRRLPLAVLMLDIDHFKRFNDSHGHDSGDALLAKFADVLQRSIRSEDIACRYGGEEFTVVMLEADADIALRCAEQVRDAVSAMSVEHRREQLPHVTVSIGLAAFPAHATTADALLRHADAALYLAKKAGRDRVVTAVSPPSFEQA